MSKKAGYRSRASLKLKEILKKENLLKRGMSVLDLGSFPGGWTQVIKENLDNEGLVIGVDIKKIETIDGTFFIHKSITELAENDFEEFIEKMPFDLVLSDIAPNISGIRETDNARMIHLVDSVLSVVDNFLNK